MRALFLGMCGVVVGCAWGCANRMSPSGGEKDTIPPSLVYSEPEAQALSFGERELTFVFDERIDEQSFRENLIITPDHMGRDFKYRIRGKKLILSFGESFRDSTTYTFNLSEAIVDITERNKARNAILSFSTTSYIDSLRIRGVVREAYTQKLVKGAIVGLSSPEDSTDFGQRRFMYSVSTDEKGRFSFENLKAAAYRVYAFKDANKNGVMDIEAEWHGFLVDTLQLREDVDSLEIALVQVDARALVHLRARPTGPYFDVRFNKRIKDYRVEVKGTEVVIDTLFYHLIDEERIIRFYPVPLGKDSAAVRIMVRDVVDNLWEADVFLRFQEGRPRKRAFELEVTKKERVHGPTDLLMFDVHFTKPVKAFDIQKVKQWENDSTSYPARIKDASWKEGYSIWRFSQHMKNENDKADRGYHWLLEKGAFVSVENDSSKEQKISHIIRDGRLFGTVSGRINIKEERFILEIIDGRYTTERKAHNHKIFSFNRLREGVYRFRVVIDEDGDGKWDAGNMLRNKAPEAVYVLEDMVRVKAHWTVENIELSL